MRLYPPVTEDEAYAWLKAQALQVVPEASMEELDPALKPLAEAMARISVTVLPDDVEPLFP